MKTETQQVSATLELVYSILRHVYQIGQFITHILAIISSVYQNKNLPTPQPRLICTVYKSMKLITHLHPVPQLRKHDIICIPLHTPVAGATTLPFPYNMVLHIIPTIWWVDSLKCVNQRKVTLENGPFYS